MEPLRSRYDTQYHRLVKFYDECKTLRYLTSIISLPNLPPDPPNLLAEDERAPRLPERPRQEIERRPTPPPPAPEIDEPEDISEFWKKEQRQQQEYEEQQRTLEEQRAQQLLAQQRMLEEQRAQQLLAQQQAAERAQREFAEQQQLLSEQQRREQEALLQQQQQWHTQGRLAELERESLNARAQYNQAQLMLQQYDQRVKTLEGELQQIDSKNDEIRAVQAQLQALQDTDGKLRSSYKTLATLYSQIRSEHLDLRKAFKSKELKAASAEEAIEKCRLLEREMRTKTLELGDALTKRDGLLLEIDRMTGEHRTALEKKERELNAERSKGRGLSDLLSDLNRQKSDLEEELRSARKKRDSDPELQDLLERLQETELKLRVAEMDVERLREKELELEVVKMGLDQALIELNDLKVQAETDRALDGQIDVVLGSHRARVDDMIDAVLQSGVQRVDDALYELESAMQAGNQNASPAYVLSQTEKASSSATEFATAFNNFIADGPEGEQAAIIRTIGVFASAISDVLGNTKGLTRLARDERTADQMLNGARQSAAATVKFFRSLLSFRLDGMDPLQKTDVVINGNNDVQVNLQRLSKLVDACAPSRGKITDDKGGDLGDLVDRELDRAADAVQAAAERLAKLRSKPKDGYATYELRVHEAMLEAAAAVTNAIAQLIRAATATQREIVQAGRGSSSRAAFYKKNNRWTDGLISAAKAVASATNTLIETADGVLSGRNSPEQLIVASNDVAASTAQLVAASRVRAGSMSQSQETLEQASKAVGTACRALVRQVQGMMADRDQEEKVDYGRLGAHEFKVREMEQQVEILQLENQLTAARTRLGEMRKVSYQE